MLATLVVTFVLYIFNSSGGSLSDNEKFRACTVDRIDCSESQPAIEAVKYLRNSYGKCKYIDGNLVICDLDRLSNGSDPDLSFLETIEEVSGYVYISRTGVKNLPLKSLRIIRGERTYPYSNNNGSLIVTRNFIENKALEVIDFRSLIAIQSGSVIVKDNPHLCNFGFTVHWEELFVNPKVQRYIPDREKTSISQRDCNIRETGLEKAQTYKSCDGACTMLNGQGYCWGPGPELCQKMVKCRFNTTQYCVNGPTGSEICSEQCLGGCTGTPSNCRACRYVENNGKCVEHCPPEYILDPATRRQTLNPDHKYHYYHECVKDCPAPFLKAKPYCVIECDLTKQRAVNGTCEPCPASGCPQHCTQESVFGSDEYFILDEEALKKFTNCSHYTGLLYVSRESFSKSPSSFIRTPIRDVSLLWNLRNLQSVVGRVYFDFRGAPAELTNLSFLHNLRTLVYEARQSYSANAIQIMNGENVEWLGFRALKSIHGRVFLVNMTKLCYLDALEKITLVRKENVISEEQCASRGAVCNSECLPPIGCWGPGADMCGHCCNQQAGDLCVSECTDHPGFYTIPDPSQSQTSLVTSSARCLTLPPNESHDVEDAYSRFSKLPAKQCGRCHSECADTCYGPEPNQCKGRCKHYQYEDQCVASCPSNTYVDGSTLHCMPCSTSCNSNFQPGVPLCSGPGSFIGLGGCTACWPVIFNTTTRTYDCLASECPAKHYEESYKLADFVRRENISVSKDSESLGRNLINVCRPCHPYCSVCTAYGTHRPSCHTCLHWWFREECMKECPPDETYTLATNATETTPLPRFTMPAASDSLDREGRAMQNAGPDDLRTLAASTLPKTSPHPISDQIQKYCLLCHSECVQGCSGPGPEACVKCRNFRVLLDADEDKFVCQSSCPEDHPKILHSMCLTVEQYAKMSGRVAREIRDRILIAVAVVIILIIILTTILLILCLKRRAEAERTRAKLFSAYTNLDASDKESLIKNQTDIREPNMGRLEMISADELEYDSTATPLGTGAFGVVYRGVWRLSKAALEKHGCHGTQKFDVAIKVLQNDYPRTPGATSPTTPNGVIDPEEAAWRAAARANIDELLQEAKVMASVEHRHCLPLIGVCLTREQHCLVTMYLELGNLERYVREHQRELNSLTLLTWAEQIADGMSYLEYRGIIHRDLAARNVLVQREDLVQITDFGLAKMLERRNEDSVVIRAGRVPIRWLAIETLQDSIYSHKTDVWAYGVTLWEIFTYGRRPYEDVETKDIKDHVMKGGRLTQPDICTLDVYMVMVKCWMEDYESRPTFAELTRTFTNFCKTPGRYLYIQGDEYAIHYPVNNTFSTSVSADAHELLPLISPRGVPDGSVSNTFNGTMGRRMKDPNFGGFAVQDNHPQQTTDDGLDEPTESDALLPVRTATHSIWSLRPRGQGVGASEFGKSTTSNGEPKATRNSHISTQKDSWLTEAPRFPNWRGPQPVVVSGRDSLQARPFSSSISPSTDGPTSGKSVPDRSATLKQDQHDSVAAIPPNSAKSPVSVVDGYLEPKTAFISPGWDNQPRQIAQEDYLIPKKHPNHPDHAAKTAFGVTNMEYCMQPSGEVYPNPTQTSNDGKAVNNPVVRPSE